MKDVDKVLTACSLTTEELRDREATLLSSV